MKRAAKASHKNNIAHAITLVRQVCEACGPRDLIGASREWFADLGLLEAIQRHDDSAIFNWLMEWISYQGISDAAAAVYMHRHGKIAAADVRAGLNRKLPCPKLKSHWDFEGCGYRKGTRTCNQPQHMRRCPLPKHDLRNGSLNQAAYSLFLFMRDVCGGDFVTWIDQQLALADEHHQVDRIRALGAAVVEPLTHVHGLSHKVLNMSLAPFLLAGDAKRERWVSAGVGMVAIDSLVHNWLHRTGILRDFNAEHAYGPGCYGDGRCSDIIRSIAKRIDARAFNSDYPKVFPRFSQFSIWRFSAQQQFNQCNGNVIDDRFRCRQSQCILFDDCARLKLGRTPTPTQAPA